MPLLAYTSLFFGYCIMNWIRRLLASYSVQIRLRFMLSDYPCLLFLGVFWESYFIHSVIVSITLVVLKTIMALKAFIYK